jgi:hypothetical protein
VRALSPEQRAGLKRIASEEHESSPARKLDVAQLLARPSEPVPYRVDKLAADGLVTVLTKHGGEGGSLLAAALAVGVACGSSPGGIQCTKGRAVIFDAEQGERLIANRLKLADAPRDGLAIYEADGLKVADHCDWLIDTIRAEAAGLVIFDSLRTLAPGMTENDGDTVLPVTVALRRLARETNAAVLTLHHRPKHGPGYRGSSVLRDQVDALLVLGREANDPERKTRRFLHCDPARDGKMRFDREPDERWLSVDVRGGLLSITETEPFGDGRDPTRTQTVAEEILAAMGGRTLKRTAIALAVDRAPKDGTVGRALDQLVADGALTKQPDHAYRQPVPPGTNDGTLAHRPKVPGATTSIGGGTARHPGTLPEPLVA